MKILFLLLPVALLSACNSSHIEFTGKAPGLTNGVFLIKEGDNTLYSDEIKTGTFQAKGELEQSGYYSLSIMDNAHPSRRDPFEIYLEPGKYTIDMDAKHMWNYPAITSASKIQQDLSAYYSIYDHKKADIDDKIQQLEDKLNGKKKASGPEATLASEQLFEAQNMQSKVRLASFREFMTQHPQSEIAAHLMAQLDYESDPQPYYAIYQKMSTEAKNSEEGKEIGLKLSTLMKLLPGAVAPTIAGTTPDGKKFNQAALDKQIYIIDFWRAGNEVSRLNHQDMLGTLLSQIDTKKAGIISISLDSKRDWWTTAIKDDHLTWTQYSDLKGDNSDNAQNWLITTIPTYYLVDSDWHIIMRDVSYSRLNFEVNDYLKHHSHRNHPVLQYSKNVVSGQMPYSYTAGEFAK